ncbi:MAG: DNA-3-methyladenine glycosylase [Gemmatimonadetes bacterium]|nr:DNA-3-methyladenine glycosylase [Gemmatimonadota bacterium]
MSNDGRRRKGALRAPFFARPASAVAPELLGALLVSELGGVRTAGRIVEVEAYEGPGDPASHAAARIGRTRRNEGLFGPPGTAYLHLNYGVHWCFNAVTDAEGSPHGVLIRALEPVQGQDHMLSRRGRDELTSGPARLTQALGIGPDLQGHRLDEPPVWIERGAPLPEGSVVTSTRIGITRGADLPLRFYDARSQWVSRR